MSQWITVLDKTLPKMNAEAVHALRAIGTNAVPQLMAGINARDSQAKQICISLIGHSGFTSLGFRTDYDKMRRALLGFEALGSNAAPAIPFLLVSLTNTVSAQPATIAYALAHIGPQGFCALTNAAVSPNHRVRAAFITALRSRFLRGGGHTPDPNEAGLVETVLLPYVLELMRDRDPDLRADAAQIFLFEPIHVNPGAVVPALERLLNDPELYPRSVAAEALGRFGPDAQSAVPALVEHAKKAKDASERQTTIHALEKIKPEAAEQFAPTNRY